MALIDLECTKCGEKFFEIISPHDVDKIKCPHCGCPVRRIYKESSCGKHSDGGPGGCSGSCVNCSGCH